MCTNIIIAYLISEVAQSDCIPLFVHSYMFLCMIRRPIEMKHNACLVLFY